jgi:hypothetical protein
MRLSLSVLTIFVLAPLGLSAAGTSQPSLRVQDFANRKPIHTTTHKAHHLKNPHAKHHKTTKHQTA